MNTSDRVDIDRVRGDGDSPSAIRADIDATRSRMGDVLEELGTRLNPERLKQEAKDTVREATIGRVETMARETMDKATDAGRSVIGVIKENPIPAAMIAAGIGWLVLSRRQSVIPKSVADGASNVASTVSSTVADTVSSVASTVGDTASDVRANVSSTVREQSHHVASVYHSNPLALGAVALAAGVAAGLAAPSTRKEGELFGEARDDLLGKARELANEKKEQVQEVAQRVIEEVAAPDTASMEAPTM